MFLRDSPRLILVLATYFLKSSCAKSSLTIVIDNTLSMDNIINQVKNEAETIVDLVYKEKSSEIENFVLVTFNDPTYRLVKDTTDRDVFKAALSSISTFNYYNYGCAEMSLSGIQMALEKSLPDSFIYVFTDASAKDYKKIEIIKELCQRKQSQVVLVVAGDCREPYSKRYTVYYEIATACSGLMLRVDENEVHKVVETIGDTIKGKKTVIVSKVVPPNVPTDVTFMIDSLVEYVLIYASGTNVSLRVNGNFENAEEMFWTTNGKAVKLSGLKVGGYNAVVSGSSATTIFMVGKTDFLFRPGFSVLPPKTFSDTTPQPVSNSRVYLSIQVTDIKRAVKIITAQILDDQGNAISGTPTLLLTEISDNFYSTTMSFAVPSRRFRVAVNGEIIATSEPISRISKMPITVQHRLKYRPDVKILEVKIKEGDSIEVAPGSTVKLTCEAHAYPKPKIAWMDDRNGYLKSETALKQYPYEYINYLTLSKVSTNNTYYCFGNNNFPIFNNIAKSYAFIKVIVKSLFKVNIVPEESTIVTVGSERTINCDVKSESPIKILWYFTSRRNGKTAQLVSSQAYLISPDGTQLTIRSMRPDMIGKYSCEASLLTNPNEKRIFSTKVEIDGVVPPKINRKMEHLKIKEHLSATINCNIVKSYPTPNITWEFKNSESSNYYPVEGSGKELHISSLRLEHSGSYRCIARVFEDHDEATVAELVVLKAPEVSIAEGKTKVVSFGSELTLTCKAMGNPVPQVLWIENQGTRIKTVNHRSGFNITHKLTRTMKTSGEYLFECNAQNDQGSTTKSIRVTVESPITLYSQPPESTIVTVGSERTINCGVKSNTPIKILWYFTSQRNGQTAQLVSSQAYLISPDGTLLTIRSMRPDMIGKYSCETSLLTDPNEKRIFSTKVEIDGVVPPKINRKMEHLKIKEHLSATINCNIVKSYPTPNITWEFKNSESSNYYPVKGSGKELHISSLRLEHSGSYRCIARVFEDHDEATVAELVVLKAPEVSIAEGKTKVVSFGSELTLTCKAMGNPVPQVLWIENQGTRIKTVNHRSGFNITHKLTRTMKTSGEYLFECNAQNDQGSTTKSIRVTVESPITLYSQPPESTIVTVGSERTINCGVKSNTPIKILWYFTSQRNGQTAQLVSSQAYLISPDGTLLTIRSMRPDMIGKYSCETSLLTDPNEKRIFSTKVEIDGVVPPKINRKMEHLKIKEHLSATINCNIVKSYPTPNITWEFKNSESSNYYPVKGSGKELHISSLRLEHSGSYRCIARVFEDHDEATVAELVVLKAPEVSIAEGKTKVVSFGSELTLTCKAMGNPVPQVLWIENQGTRIKTVNHRSGFNITHKLTRTMKTSGEYLFECNAQNDQGSTTKSIRVTVESPITLYSQPPESTIVTVGSERTINCGVKSKSPIKILWYFTSRRNGQNGQLVSSQAYLISPDGTRLTIRSMRPDMIGKYSCEASLLTDPNEKRIFSTEVEIDGIVPPKIDRKMEYLKIKENQSATINCNIVKSYPTPNITWEFKNSESSNYYPVKGSGKELHIPSLSLEHSGSYRCIARVFEDHDEATVAELVVLKAPEVSIAEGKTKVVPFGSELTLTCKAIGNPVPHVLWTDSHGRLNNTVNHHSGFNVTHRLTTFMNISGEHVFKCNAQNDLGSTTESMRVTVESPFTLYSRPPDTMAVSYGTDVNLVCDVRSHYGAVKIDWYFTSNKTLEEKLEYSKYKLSSDRCTLTIPSIDMSLEGRYTCKVTLASESDENISLSTNVIIKGLVSLMIDPRQRTIKVKENEDATISCKITRGNPPPQISWKFKKAGSNSYEPILGSAHELYVRKAILSNAGQYKCIAENPLNKDEITVAELVVLKAPVVTIFEGEYVNVPYGSKLTLSCGVTAYPEPNVTWTDNGGNILPTTVTNSTVRNYNKYTHFITLVKMKSSGRYHCHAQNDQGSDTKCINVDVASPFLIQSQPPDTIKGLYGSEVSLKHKITSKLPIKIRWYSTDSKSNKTKQIEASKNYFISSNGGELKIKPMDFGLNGEYICKVSLQEDENEFVEFSTNVELTGLEIPEVTGDSDKIVRLGASVAIHCNVTKGVPKPKLSWKFIANEDNVTYDINKIDDVYNIPNVQGKDSGHYKCIADNDMGSDEHVTILTVQEPVRIVPEMSTAYEGIKGDSTLTLPCKVVGYPKPTVKWMISGSIIIPNKKYMIKDDALVINNLEKKDTNLYTCSASNDVGIDNRTIEVRITEGLENYGIWHKEYIREGQSMKIICNLPKSGSTSVRWFVDGKEVNIHTPYFSISNADYSHNGNYTCHVSGASGSTTETFKVVVGFPPQFINSQEDQLVLWDGDSKETLDCDAKAKPSPKVEWRFNGIPVDDAIYLQQNVFKWGLYTCNVSNAFGSVQNNFTVKGSVCMIGRNKKDAPKMPLILNDKLAWPDLNSSAENLKVQLGEKLVVSCPNTKSTLNGFQNIPSQNIVEAICDNGDTFLIDGKPYQFQDLQCINEIYPKTIINTMKCMSENADLIQVGYDVNGFVEAYRVCFDNNRNIPLYTVINISETNNVPSAVEKWYRYPGIGTGDNEGAYTCKTSSSSCCYAKSQLVSAEDLIYGSPQNSSFIDPLNAIPLWKPCDNRTTWEQINDMVRSQAKKEPHFSVTSGTHTLQDINGATVPRYLWKMVKVEDAEPMAIVYVNGPHPTFDDILCPDVCSSEFDSWLHHNDDSTYCCAIDDFFDAFQLPGELLEGVKEAEHKLS